MSNPLHRAFSPSHEGDRLAAVRRLNLLDSPQSESFDRITRLTAHALKVPIALVSLVDEARQWFKSKVGLDVVQTPRSVSFCTYAIAEQRLLVVPDAAADSRFASSPLVTGEPHIRAYAGAPIHTSDGHAIGTLCAIDREPRTFTDAELGTLRDCAILLEDLIKSRETSTAVESELDVLRERETVFRETFERCATGLFHTTMSGHLLRINARACELLGFTPAELREIRFAGLVHPDDVATDAEQVQALLRGAVARVVSEKRYLRKDGSYLWCRIASSVVRSRGDSQSQLVGVMEDVSESRRLREDGARQAAQVQTSHAALRDNVIHLLDTERALRHLEERLKTLADNVPALVGYWDENLECRFANEAYRGAFGRSPQEIIGMSMVELLGEESFKETEPYARRALEGHAQRFERSIERHGVDSFFEVRYFPDRDLAKRSHGFFVVVTDVTELRRAQISLRGVEARRE